MLSTHHTYIKHIRWKLLVQDSYTDVLARYYKCRKKEENVASTVVKMLYLLTYPKLSSKYYGPFSP